MQARTVDIGHALDLERWTAFQKFVAVIAALSVVVDGFDGQLIGFAIPILIRDWGVARAAFTPIVTAGIVGMGLGSACAGLIGDRFGRRRALILSIFVFALATACIGFANSLFQIGAIRFVAGLGIGGALPSATTIAAEFTPARHRTVAVTATIVCVPIGGVLSGLFAGSVLPSLGWRPLFWIGGAVPLLLAVVLTAILPESPRFLARHPARWDELRRLLRQMKRPVAAEATFTDRAEQVHEHRGGMRVLFEGGRARDTLSLCLTFCLSLFAIYNAFSWLPTLLSGEGLSVAASSAGLTSYNFGGIIGALLCAAAISRLGSRWPLAFCALAASASALVLSRLGASHPAVLIAWIGLHGLFVNAVQTTLFAVCAHVYPTRIRATGTAASLAFGRSGAIASGLVGAAVITAGGGAAYFGMLAATMLGAAVALLLIANHIPPLGLHERTLSFEARDP